MSGDQTTMTDAELADFLGFTHADDPEKVKRAIRSLVPEKRAAYERMARITTELQLYEQGLGPKPAGVLVDWDRSKRRGR